MRQAFYGVGLAAIVIGAVIAAQASGVIGDPSLRFASSRWMYGGLLISLAGAATIFVARGAR